MVQSVECFCEVIHRAVSTGNSENVEQVLCGWAQMAKRLAPVFRRIVELRLQPFWVAGFRLLMGIFGGLGGQAGREIVVLDDVQVGAISHEGPDMTAANAGIVELRNKNVGPLPFVECFHLQSNSIEAISVAMEAFKTLTGLLEDVIAGCHQELVLAIAVLDAPDKAKE